MKASRFTYAQQVGRDKIPPSFVNRRNGGFRLRSTRPTCFMNYNVSRIHKSLKVTPAMAVGVTDRLWVVEGIVKLVDEMHHQPKKRSPYKKQGHISERLTTE